MKRFKEFLLEQGAQWVKIKCKHQLNPALYKLNDEQFTIAITGDGEGLDKYFKESFMQMMRKDIFNIKLHDRSDIEMAIDYDAFIEYAQDHMLDDNKALETFRIELQGDFDLWVKSFNIKTFAKFMLDNDL